MTVNTFQTQEPRLMIIADKNNPKALDLTKKLKIKNHEQANLIVVIGGDGMMLHAIRKYYHLGLPFFGLNVGHRGFLMNELECCQNNFPENLFGYQLPLLKVEMESESGKIKHQVAFNDAWVERASSQTAHIRVISDGIIKINDLVADGILVSTPAGSTAYANAMGASPVPLDAEILVMVGSNVSSPNNFRPVYLPFSSKVEFIEASDDPKRKLIGVVDGIRHGIVKRMLISKSNFSVRLMFADNDNLLKKLASIQFPG